MNQYLGEELVDIKDTPYKGYTQSDWALHYVGIYGQFAGSHHKDWVLDHVVRILNGTTVKIKLAKWSDGTEEYRVSLNEPSAEYVSWVEKIRFDEDGEEYGYNIGVAP